jgi:DNA-directed RNA polymerase subunit RPC12/RpoP
MIVDNLCEALGIVRTSYFQRLQGNISLKTLTQIAEVLGCREAELLIEPCEQIVPTDCANNEPIVTNLIECPNCGQKLFVHAINDIK